MGNVKPLKTY